MKTLLVYAIPKEGMVLHLGTIKDHMNNNIDVQYIQQRFCMCPYFLRVRKICFC